MIGYIFTENELKLLCGAMNIRALAKHQFPNMNITAKEWAQAEDTLAEKGFAVKDGGITIGSGIALMIRSMGKAERLFIGDGERKFTAYICPKISLLLINDVNSRNYMLCPFENEDFLAEYLNENGLYEWKDIRVEEKNEQDDS